MFGNPKVYSPQDKTPTPIDRLLGNGALLGVAGIGALVTPVALIAAAWYLFNEPFKAFVSSQFWVSLVMMGLGLFVIIHLCAALILAERKISAYVQDRKGPNRVGLWGVAQPIADGIKFILKEDIIPAKADAPLFILAPCITFVLALIGFAIIPWAGRIEWPWMKPGEFVHTAAADLDVGILYVLAVGSLAVYGVVLAGWSSNNKYAHFGGMRATAQMLSYEVPLGLGLLVLVLSAGSLQLQPIIDQQSQSGFWNILMHPIAAFLVLVSAFAETNRAPFDLAECEQELVAGFHTEYSSMKFALFFLGEYSHVVTASAIFTCLFLGGYTIPFMGWLNETNTWWAALIKFHVIWAKVLIMIGFFMMIRWTIPRFRFDQLMRLAWKGMVPMGMASIGVTSVAVACGWRIAGDRPVMTNAINAAIMLGLNVGMFVVAMIIAGRSKVEVTGRQEYLPPVNVMATRGA